MEQTDVIDRGEAVTLLVNGRPVQAYRGQTIAAALLAAGQRTLRHTRRAGKPRGLFCAMGVCYDCVVTVNGESGVRACMRRVEEGMQVTSPAQFGFRGPRP
jgi:predicted molibdopterin-dependent oxidoreductase YjgC